MRGAGASVAVLARQREEAAAARRSSGPRSAGPRRAGFPRLLAHTSAASRRRSAERAAAATHQAAGAPVRLVDKGDLFDVVAAEELADRGLAGAVRQACGAARFEGAGRGARARACCVCAVCALGTGPSSPARAWGALRHGGVGHECTQAHASDQGPTFEFEHARFCAFGSECGRQFGLLGRQVQLSSRRVLGGATTAIRITVAPSLLNLHLRDHGRLSRTQHLGRHLRKPRKKESRKSNYSTTGGLALLTWRECGPGHRAAHAAGDLVNVPSRAGATPQP